MPTALPRRLATLRQVHCATTWRAGRISTANARTGAALFAAGVVALALAGPGRASGLHAGGSPSPAAALAEAAAAVDRGLHDAVAAGRVAPVDAARYRNVLRTTVSTAPTLPPLRTAVLTTLVGDLAAAAPLFDAPRTLTLFSALALNLDRLTTSPIPTTRADVTDADGIIYRWFAGRGFQFHPLANFAALNNLVSGQDYDGAERLATALLARAEPARGGLVWEYWFPFGKGDPPWVSGMAEAVAAQAFARAVGVIANPDLLEAARAASRVAASLTLQLTAGPWVQLYSFSKELVLIAQLQSAISLAEFAGNVDDPAAAALAARLRAAAVTLLPRFDTGAWSLYSLDGPEADTGYHQFVVDLLRKLGDQTGEPVWTAAADRFAGYETQPPLLQPGATPEATYPVPADGYRDDVPVAFSVSKRSDVTLLVDGKPVARATFAHGTGLLRWMPGTDATPGLHPASLLARAVNGTATTLELPPLELRHDSRAPVVTVRVVGRWIAWTTTDEGTPWLELRVVLRQGPRVLIADLGRHATAGAVKLPVPPGRWQAELIATNSAGKGRRVPLGLL